MKQYGPSRTEIINEKIARKHFDPYDLDRMNKEVHKLIILKNISDDNKNIVFNVPKVIEIGEYSYDLEYIPEATQLGECGFMFTTEELISKIKKIINLISTRYSSLNVWYSMKDKFLQLKTDNSEYNELVRRFPKEIIFKNQDGYSHGDLSFDNILVSNGRFYLIDPSWSSVESPLWDVGKVLQSVLINWGGIKEKGRAIADDRPGWMCPLLYNVSGKQTLLDYFVKEYGYDAVLISTACQLSRVSRWCFPEVLIPVINKLLKMYFKYKEDGNENIDALCRVI